MNNLITTIFFDIDDTLLIHKNFEKKVCYYLIQEYAKNDGISFDDARRKFLRFLDTVKGTYIWFDWNIICDYFGISRNSWKIAHMKYLYLIRPHKDVRPSLDMLKKRGFKLGIMSDAIRAVAELKLAKTKLLSYFNFIYTSDIDKLTKNKQEYFKRALERFSLSPEECVYVGDGHGKDTKIANSVGMVSVLVDRLN